MNGSISRSMFLLQGQISIDGGERLTFWWPVSKKLHNPGHSVVLLQLLLNTKERWTSILSFKQHVFAHYIPQAAEVKVQLWMWLKPLTLGKNTQWLICKSYWAAMVINIYGLWIPLAKNTRHSSLFPLMFKVGN